MFFWESWDDFLGHSLHFIYIYIYIEREREREREISIVSTSLSARNCPYITIDSF